MNIEKWGKQPIREVPRKPAAEVVVPGAGQEHMEAAPKSSSETGGTALLAKVLRSHDDEEVSEVLLAAFDRLLNYSGVQAAWLEDLNEAGRENVRTLVADYLAAETQKELGNKLTVQKKFERLFA